ncbi:hypothetical protein KFE25_013411 [Diacronema lutheri]|uniref:PDZ domain-containing protein n=1 Tax=Diacronema lutheri TaxID=2081491 RepID=A0A8J5XND0_DIALT|nr:hypothetical protein KFE25_013411 [Diacronema lutheri]
MGEAAVPSWRLSRKLVRDRQSGRVQELTELEPSSAEWEVSEVAFALPTAPSLGIELSEVTGEVIISGEGTKLTQSIVFVTALVPGGNAARLGACAPGDTIIAVGSGLGDVVNTEGANYEATVRAIGAIAAEHDEITLVAKRLVRRSVARVTAVLPGGGEATVLAFEGENLRMALIRQGIVSINDDRAQRYDGKGSGNCGGNGVCCTCVVSVLDGAQFLNERTRSERQLLRKVARWRQSCRARVQIGRSEAAGPVDIRVQLGPRSPPPAAGSAPGS